LLHEFGVKENPRYLVLAPTTHAAGFFLPALSARGGTSKGFIQGQRQFPATVQTSGQSLWGLIQVDVAFFKIGSG